MKCEKCGADLASDANFCRICGEPVPHDDKKEEVEENHDIELTDNIDVTKITLEKADDDDEKEKKSTNKDKKDAINSFIDVAEEEKSEDEVVEKKEENKHSTPSVPSIFKTGVSELDDTDADLLLDDSSAEEDQEDPSEDFLDDKLDDKKEDKSESEELEVIEQDKDNKKDDESSSKQIEDILEEMKEESHTEQKVDLLALDKKYMTEKKLDETKNNLDALSGYLSSNAASKQNSDEEAQVDLLALPGHKRETYDSNVKVSVDLNSSEKSSSEASSKNKKSKVNVALIVLLVLSLIGVAFFGYLFINTNNKFNTEEKDNTKLEKDLKKVTEERDSLNAKTKELTFNGYLFQLPDTYTVSNNTIMTGSEKNKINLEVALNVGYATISQNRDTYRNKLVKKGFKVNSHGTKMIDKREYIVYEINDLQNNFYLVAYTKLSDVDSIGFVISNEKNNIDYGILEVTNEIIASAKKISKYVPNNLKLFD